METFLGQGEHFEQVKESWTQTMHALKNGEGVGSAPAWEPLTTERTPQPVVDVTEQRATIITERQVRENVPQALHAGWSRADKDRANQVPPLARTYTWLMCMLTM